MPKKIITQTVAPAVSVKQIAGLTGMMYLASAAIATILTVVFAVR